MLPVTQTRTRKRSTVTQPLRMSCACGERTLDLSDHCPRALSSPLRLLPGSTRSSLRSLQCVSDFPVNLCQPSDGHVSGFSTLCHWPRRLSHCQHDTVWICVATEALKPGRQIPPTSFFFCKIIFRIEVWLQCTMVWISLGLTCWRVTKASWFLRVCTLA